MVTNKEILRLLAERDIPAVLIGGLALRIYNSPRVSRDLALAIRSLDAGRVIALMYERGFRVVSAVGERDAELPPSALEAAAWVESSGASSLAFVQCGSLATRVPLSEIDLGTRVDFLSDLAVPVMRLRERARTFDIDDFRILVAAPRDLLELKKGRGDRSAADLADIAFLEELVSRGA